MKKAAAAVFGERLRIARKRKGISMQGLANAIEVHRTTISRWEKGGAEIPSAFTTAKLGDVLDVAVRYLLGQDQHPEKPIRLSPQARRLVALFEQLDGPGQEVALEMLQEAIKLHQMGRSRKP